MVYTFIFYVAPNLDKLHLDVSNSEMTNKELICCRWDKEDNLLKVNYNGELSISDKEILDNIVSMI